MTDPERISKRSSGLAAQLLQAGGDEQPGAAGIERTLAALGVSGALLTTAVATNAAAAGGAKLSSAALAGSAAGATAAGVAGSGANVVTATLLVKWIGVGVLGGATLSGAASLLSGPATSASTQGSQVSAPVALVTPSAAPNVVAATVEVPAPSRAASAAALAAPVVAPSIAGPAAPASNDLVVEAGAPLAAEVAFIDGARALLASGQAEQGLSQLRRYEQDFPEGRLLPEVLFLRMETCDRLGRSGEARAAATRLVQGFAHSPHAARARKLLQR